MISWNLLLVAGCVIGVYLSYKEWTRKRRAHLFARPVASLLAITSLLAMAYPYAENNKEVKKIVLLTDGYIRDSVDRFVQNNQGVVIFSTTAVKKNSFPRQVVLPVITWESFGAFYPGQPVEVFGNGLDKEVLEALHPRPIVFHPNPVLFTISHVYWKQHLQTGEPLNVQGHCENNSGGKIRLALQAFGSIKDTVVIGAGQEKDFALHTIPLHTGNATYSLLVIRGNDTIRHEPVPVSVDIRTPLKLLIISAAPDFENTYLKNYLSQQAYPVAISTVISTNSSNQQFINTTVQKGSLLSSSYLTQFDVLLTDAATLGKLSKPERAAIASALQSMGTGLLIKTDTAARQGDFYTSFFPVKTLQQKQSIFLLHEVASDSNRYKIKIPDPACIVYNSGTQPLLLDEQSNIFASAMQYGNGKIIASTLSGTYSLALAGNMDAYRRLWSLLLSKASKKTFPAASWLIDPFIPHINRPVHLQAIANDGMLPATVVQNAHIYLQQDRGLPFQYNGTYWPAAAGWQSIPLPGNAAYTWYAYQADDWKTTSQYPALQQTWQYVKRHPVAKKESGTIGSFTKNWYLLMLLLFLGTCVFLWVEQKTG